MGRFMGQRLISVLMMLWEGNSSVQRCRLHFNSPFSCSICLSSFPFFPPKKKTCLIHFLIWGCTWSINIWMLVQKCKRTCHGYFCWCSLIQSFSHELFGLECKCNIWNEICYFSWTSNFRHVSTYLTRQKMKIKGRGL